MYGAIAGDIIGAPYEFFTFKEYNFSLFTEKSDFTDDTVLTVAVADAFMNDLDIAKTIKKYALRYPARGYGGNFHKWMYSDNMKPYNSWGNGSAMRTSVIGFLSKSVSEVCQKAREFAEVTHNHPEGIKGAQAVSYAIFLAQNGADKKEIREETERWFAYDLSRTLDEIRPTYIFDVSCQGSVPQSFQAFFESEDYEDAIRKAISLGGDADTLACITGSIAEAFYGEIPDTILSETRKRLPEEFLQVIDSFYEKIKIR